MVFHRKLGVRLLLWQCLLRLDVTTIYCPCQTGKPGNTFNNLGRRDPSTHHVPSLTTNPYRT